MVRRFLGDQKSLPKTPKCKVSQILCELSGKFTTFDYTEGRAK